MRRYINIRGHRWKLVVGRPPVNSCSGLCDYQARTIYIRLSSKEKRATAIHEVLHACLPDIEEQAIVDTEKALCGILDLMKL